MKQTHLPLLRQPSLQPRLATTRLLGLALFLLLAANSQAAVFVVNTTGDAADLAPNGVCDSDTIPGSQCTLRAAIQEADAVAGADSINFNIPVADPGFGGGVFTIQPASPLPPLAGAAGNGTIIDGATQTAFTGNTNPNGPEVVLNGALAGAVSGLRLNAANCGVRGLVINGFHTGGINISGAAATGNKVQNCYLGTNPAGTTSVPLPAPNTGAGVVISGGATNNLVGGITGQGNLISGNGDNTNVSLSFGVRISGAGTNGNTVQGNLIGTDRTGAVALKNQVYGVRIEGSAQNNLVGGAGATAPVRNVISGNGFPGAFDGIGVEITDPKTIRNRVEGNLIGTNAAGNAAVPNVRLGVAVVRGAQANRIGGTTPGTGNVISGNPNDGVVISDPGTDGNLTAGNLIGTDAAGTAAIPNAAYGVVIENGAQGNLVGGTTAQARNVISGNGIFGVIFIHGGTDNNRVQGNYIGTDRNGTAPLPNGTGGVRLSPKAPAPAGPQANSIGGTAAGAGNLISGNNGIGVDIFGAGTDNNLVEGNRIGTNPGGTAALPNTTHGVAISGGAQNNLVGGSIATARNLISGNRIDGILINGTTGNANTNNNRVQGNYIGSDVNGTTALSNMIGVEIKGGAQSNLVGGANTAGATPRNLIAGNRQIGVWINSAGTSLNKVQGNYIGTAISGNVSLGLQIDGVEIREAPNNTVGGSTPEVRNLISGNRSPGVDLVGAGASGNVVQGNFIGTNAAGNAKVPNGRGVSVQLGAQHNGIGGSTAATRNVISGNLSSGVIITAPGTTNNLVRGNFIGLNAAGAAALSNGGDGVQIINGAPTNTVGGAVVGAGNVIAGNAHFGVRLDDAGTTGNMVQGNRIGTNPAGSAAIANGQSGVLITGGAPTNLVGGTTPAARNLISGNGEHGVILSDAASGNKVQGNYIGTDAAGNAKVPNVGAGVYVAGTPKSFIGGSVAGTGNLISGNGAYGIYITDSGTTGNLVQGNRIGTNAAGTAQLGNTISGVGILQDAASNLVGGTTKGTSNLISGNLQHGVLITGSGAGPTTKFNRVLGNLIGTDVGGSAPLGNGGAGVSLSGGATSNDVGGTAAGAGNRIAFNRQDGVQVRDTNSTLNSILTNSIWKNVQLGIDLIGGVQNAAGVTANDAQDPDTGPNNLQNYPRITSAVVVGGNTNVTATLNSTPNTTFTIEFFLNPAATGPDPSGFGEGQLFVLRTVKTTDAAGNVPFFTVAVPGDFTGDTFTATATSKAGDTSEFSGAITAIKRAPLEDSPEDSGEDSEPSS